MILILPLANVVEQHLYEDDSVDWSKSSTLACMCEEPDRCKAGLFSQNCHFEELCSENLCSKLSPFESHSGEENVSLSGDTR